MFCYFVYCTALATINEFFSAKENIIKNLLLTNIDLKLLHLSTIIFETKNIIKAFNSIFLTLIVKLQKFFIRGLFFLPVKLQFKNKISSIPFFTINHFFHFQNKEINIFTFNKNLIAIQQLNFCIENEKNNNASQKNFDF